MGSFTSTTTIPFFCLLCLGITCPLCRIDAFLTSSSRDGSSVVVNSLSHWTSANYVTFQHHQQYLNTFVDGSTTRLAATIDRASESTSSLPNGKQQVLFQKVIRPTQSMPEVLFLGYLIEYLEKHFRLPDDLPMVYDSELAESNESSRYTLAWDSPLSPSADATRMEVEVVGIYTEEAKNNDSSPSVPNMAMVVVRRPEKDRPTSSIPPMMKGLFEDSEKKIIQALDRGLDDFVAGKIRFDMSDSLAEERTQGRGIPQNVHTAEEAIDAELVDVSPPASSPSKDVVLDAQVTSDTEDSPKETKQARKDAVARAMATMQKPAQTTAPNPKTDNTVDYAVAAAKRAIETSKQTKPKAQIPTKRKKETRLPTSSDDERETEVDFAVAAAKKAAALRKTSVDSSNEDFAVAAARKMATKAARKSAPRKAASSKNKIRGTSKSKTPQTTQGPAMPPVPKGWKPRDYFKNQRAFVGTISTPKKMDEKAKQEFKVRQDAAKAKIGTQKKGNNAKSESVSNDLIENRNLNAKVIDASLPDDETKNSVNSLLEEVSRGDKDIPSDKEIELEIMKAAQSALDEMESQGGEMTPEEMLKDVLKFDEEKKKEEETGNGFVSGAFEKAKELMKARHQQIEERQQKQRQQEFKEFETPNQNDFPKYPDAVDFTATDSKRELTEEEELRAMFAAGQKIADGKIESSQQNVGGLAKKGTTEEDIDRLIAEEKTVSKYARVLDDELTELEVRINASPGEELDGPMQNPIFDVMSGPEVYNPNVELDAVNYPGAMPGTAEVKLPKELDEAMKQAEFAASVIMSMETKETKDERTGQTVSVQYFSGKKELTQKQVENLQKVVSEAVKCGIIDDPLEVMAEQSRLQLVLDELWNQPEERFHEIASNYKDLLLSDRFVGLIRERLTAMADRDLDALRRDDESLREPHERERDILGQLVVYAQALLKETRALGAELEATQLEVIRSICKVAMDPAHTTEEETAMALSDAVRDMRPLLDDAFVAYLKYAVAEEEAKLARAGLLDDPDYNQWLFVLKIVQQGVYAEVAKGINRYIEHIWYVIRMDTPQQRRKLLERLIDDMPTMDVRPFVQVVDNIVGSLGDGVNGNFDGLVPLGEMTNTLLQLQHDVQELLPPERIAEKSRDADEWAARQKKRLMEQRKIGQQRLEAAKEVGHLESDIDAAFGSGGGEVDRFD